MVVVYLCSLDTSLPQPGHVGLVLVPHTGGPDSPGVEIGFVIVPGAIDETYPSTSLTSSITSSLETLSIARLCAAARNG